MKRDVDLVRRIMLDIEQCPADQRITDFHFDGYDRDIVVRHVELLIEAGLVDGQVTHFVSNDPPMILIRDLTWFGHDFIDAVRDDTIWKKIVDNVVKPTASWTFSLVLEYAKAEIKSRLGL